MSAEAAAKVLLTAREQRLPVGKLPPGLAPRDVGEGVATQVALAHLLDANPPGGFKIGAIAKRMQENLGIHAPIAGFMRAQDIHASGARLRFADYIGLGVECELAVRLSRDLPPGPCDAGQASEAVGDMFAAIEIVENRYAPDFTSVGVPTLVADQMFHAACVIGTAARWRDLDLARIPGEIFRDGIRVDGGTGGDLMGHPLRALAWLAGSPEAAGFGGLRAGQVVMLGSVTPPVWLGGPCRITVHFTGMEPVELQFD